MIAPWVVNDHVKPSHIKLYDSIIFLQESRQQTYYEICEVILLIAVSMLLFLTVDWKTVVVVLGVSNLKSQHNKYITFL